MTTENIMWTALLGIQLYYSMWHLEQILSAKTRLNANLTQWRHEYVTSPAATSPT